MKYILAIFAVLFLTEGGASAMEEDPVIDQADGINYSLGSQIGNDLRQQDLEINLEAFLQGVEDAMSGKDPRLGRAEMEAKLQALKSDIQNHQLQKRKKAKRELKDKYRREGQEFLAKNAQDEGVVTLPSGLQYLIIKTGSGKRPGPHDMVKVQYRGTLLDGNEFDSSYRRNTVAEYRVDGVIAGWTEALQMMKEGGKWRIFVPADLAYGERGPLADRTVIFDIELVSIEK